MSKASGASARNGVASGREIGRQSALARLADRMEALIDWLGRIAAWLAFALVALVAFNVILRYLFSVGPVWLQEMEWHLISPIVMVGVAYAMRHGEHVRVDLLFEHFPRWLQQVIDILIAIVTVIICIIVIDMSLAWVAQAYRIGEGSPDPGGLPYRFILKAFVPFGFLLLLVQAAAQGIKTGLLLFGPQEDRRHG